MSISAVVLTKNEEKNIIECLKTLEWCDEIIIIDDYSEDETLEKVNPPAGGQKSKVKSTIKKLKVYRKHLNNDFSAQRNYGLQKTTSNWVLFVDADERVSAALAAEISNLIRQLADQISNVNGFYLKRKDFLFGKWLEHGETGNIKLLRLAKKNAGKWVRPVHEVWQTNGGVEELRNPLLHYPHQTIKEFLEDINFYTSLNAQVFYKEGVKGFWWQIIGYPVGKFANNYFLKLGLLDGMAGLLQAIFMSFHSFLTRAKLWFLWQKNGRI